MQQESIYSNIEEFTADIASVTVQPTFDSREVTFPGSRRPIPVSVIDQNSSQPYYMAPLSGLDFLLDVDQLIIQRSVELADLMSNVSSENRYTIKVPRGDTIFYATESSGNIQRMIFSSGRAFNMRLYDRTQQEAIHFKRRLACGTCTFWCYLQEMEIWIPPGELLGIIKQTINFKMITTFDVIDRHNEVIFKIEGPTSFCCLLGKTQSFKIYNRDGSTQIGNIIHQWDQMQVSYNILLQMPTNISNNRHKALLLGAAFLLEYMFFESSTKKTYLRCIC